MLSIVFGTAYEVHPNDESLGHVNVRPYRAGHASYVGIDSTEVIHVCDEDCLARALPDEYVRCEDRGAYVSGHPWRDEHGTRVRTADILDFDPGDDPYILCAECGAELRRDDEAYEAMFGRKIGQKLRDSLGALEQSLMDAWPGDTEFVILRASDWAKVRFCVNDLIGVEGTVMDGIDLIPVVLDLPDAED